MFPCFMQSVCMLHNNRLTLKIIEYTCSQLNLLELLNTRLAAPRLPALKFVPSPPDQASRPHNAYLSTGTLQIMKCYLLFMILGSGLQLKKKFK